MIHYAINGRTACGEDVDRSRGHLYGTHWPDVTCGACRLEQPQTAQPGQVEYQVPENVMAKDRELAEYDRQMSAIDPQVFSGVGADDTRWEDPRDTFGGNDSDMEKEFADRRAARKAELLKEVDAIQEKCLAEIRFWSERMAECVALREKLKGGSAPEARRKYRDPQDFVDGLAGYAARQRESVAPAIAPWHP